MGDLGLSTAPLKRQPNPDTPPGPLWHETLLRKIRVLWEQSGHCLCWGGCTGGLMTFLKTQPPAQTCRRRIGFCYIPPPWGGTLQ